MKTSKNWITLMLTVSISILAVMAGIIIYVDPFFQYHKPLPDFPYLVDNQLSQNPGMAENFQYDSVILGSSMTVNFNTDWFQELYGLRTIKLNYNGAFPKDQANIMDVIFKANPQVERIFLGIDIPSYSGGVEEVKYPIPAYLYDQNYFNDIAYVLNKEVLLDYVLRPMANPEKTDLATVYQLWFTDEYFNKDYVLKYYEAPDMVEREVPREEYMEALKKNLDVNIAPYIENHPDTEFTIFFLPFSILYWYGIQRENKLEATLEEYRYTAKRLLEYENVRFFMFSDLEWLIGNLDNYADYSHYHQSINRYMTECFGNGEGQVRIDTVEERIDNMRRIAMTYDYDSIFEEN